MLRNETDLNTDRLESAGVPKVSPNRLVSRST